MSSLSMTNIVLLMLSTALLGSTASTRRAKEGSLQRNLLQNYYQFSTPETQFPKSPFNVYLFFSLAYINSFDEKLGILTTALSATSMWFDSDLSWNSTEHGGITRIKVLFFIILVYLMMHQHISDHTAPIKLLN